MEKCREHKDGQLRDYFLHRLTPEEVEAFQFHLCHCEVCRKNLERMRFLSSYKEEVFEINKKMSNLEKRHLVLAGFPRVMFAACVILALVIGGYYWGQIQFDEELQLEMNEPPSLQSGDSIGVEQDSVVIKLNEEGVRNEVVE